MRGRTWICYVLLALGQLVWAHAQDFRASYYELEVQVEPNTQRIAGTQRIQLEALRAGAQIHLLLAEDLKVKWLKVDGQNQPYRREADTLRVNLTRRRKAGSKIQLELLYGGDVNGPLSIWQDRHVRLSPQFLPAHHWWPTAGPADSLRLLVIAPEERAILVPGELKQYQALPGQYLRRTYAYPFSLAPSEVYLFQGPFTEVRDEFSSAGRSVPLRYIAPGDRLGEAKEQLAVTRLGLEWLTDQLGAYPYPDKGLTWIMTEDPQSLPQSGELSPELLVQLSYPWLGQFTSPRDSLAAQLLAAFRAYLPLHYLASNGSGARLRQTLVDARPPNWEAGLIYTLLHLSEGYDDYEDLMAGLLRRFGGEEVSGNALIDHLNYHFQGNLGPAVVQYLLYRQLPKLEYEVVRNGRKYALRYRWVAALPEFTLPVWFWIDEEPLFVEANTDWQYRELKGVNARQIRLEPTRGWFEFERLGDQ
ncbi:MAG: hypothetical protein AAF804_04670 [Bacteroidota bacterium]